MVGLFCWSILSLLPDAKAPLRRVGTCDGEDIVSRTGLKRRWFLAVMTTAYSYRLKASTVSIAVDSEVHE